MSTLILTLPPTAVAATPEYDYVLTPDGQQVGAHGRAAASLLPAQPGRGTEVVALIPAQSVSWHCVTVPERVLRSLLSARLEPARARAVLSGVLEEQLLDDADNLHFAVFAAMTSEPAPAANAWVAICDRAWLHGHLQALEVAGRAVSRIAAECTPAPAGAAHALLVGEGPDAQLQICDAQGVRLLPLQGAGLALALADADLEIRAEPAAMALAQTHFGNRVSLQSHAEHVLEAARSPWNLAQMELTASASGRLGKRLRAGWQQLLQAPQWRPVRWGLTALLLVHVVALNAMAWQQRRSLDEQRSAIQRVLRQTFPDIQLVIDAPLQMQRAVDDLARARGMGSDADLGRVLSLVTTMAPPTTAVSSIDFSGRQIRLKTTGLPPGHVTDLNTALESRGLRSRLQDDALVIEPKEQR
ncbi:type II secretion system protein GspL [Rhodoferax sp. GW822-FHT02A01]|uniref:type II secretion system protein GspL n=1 Tax=Rhodoferax sp. GW822-FHT02A01 TaxID=3141537 RepID=UPI00315D858D